MANHHFTARLLALVLCIAGAIGGAFANPAASSAIRLTVDVTDAPRKVFHSEMTIPVRPGPLTLYYPKYIPGEHGPTGPIVNVTGLKFEANGKAIPWHRDAVDMYAFHLDVPKGIDELQASLDFLSPVGEGDFTAGVSATPRLVDLNWNQVVLYPAGVASDAITFKPSLEIPQGWKFASALSVADRDANVVTFDPVSLTTLVDSPVVAGKYFRRVDLAPGAALPHHLNIVADSAEALEMSDSAVRHHRNLVREASALFGSHHYSHYDFLLTLSDQVAHFGLEHHQSSDDRTDETLFTNSKDEMLGAGLLPHEFVHSWNGKFRRPADLTTPDYEQPMKTDMLWVYEGLTTYLGGVLTTRSGLWTPAIYRDYLAYYAAQMDHRTGRIWRPLADTTTAAQILYGASHSWSNWRRRTDFYPEGMLIWLAVDAKIRELTRNRQSLDDFCKLFFGIEDGRIKVHPYTLDDLVKTLNLVAPFDWAHFLNARLQRTGTGAPLDGMQHSGWKLVYTDRRSEYQAAREERRKFTDMMYSVGLRISDEDQSIEDVLWHGPAFEAGMGAGMKLVAVNGRKYTPDVLRNAVAAARDGNAPLELMVETQDFYRTYKVDYHGGLKYPHLEREQGAPDYLRAILAAHAGG